MIDANILQTLQTQLVDHIRHGYGHVTQYALHLLYIFSGMEFALFGLLWAIQQEPQWRKLLLDVMKLSFLFFVIFHLNDGLHWILASFLQVSQDVHQQPDSAHHLMKLWDLAYMFSTHVFQSLQTSASQLKIPAINLIIGFGTLFSIGWMILNIVLQYAAFYLVGLFGLLLLPFSMLHHFKHWSTQIFQSLLSMGIRLATMLIVWGLAYGLWMHLRIPSLAAPYPFNFAMGVFLASLALAYLLHQLPKLAGNLLGTMVIPGAATDSGTTTVVNTTTSAQAMTSTMHAAPTSVAQATQAVQQATHLSAHATQAAASTVQVKTSQANTGLSKRDRNTLKSVSDKTLAQVRDAFKQMKQQGKGHGE
ncbi:MAG: hypothetical protein DHS20C10_00820 [marine bacterium B5-7]|nr:MAG: hypothetical protein DHS20C10_00820 [marine bacterium B5-7]